MSVGLFTIELVMVKKLYIGSDHAGFELKQNFIARLKADFSMISSLALAVEDMGTHSLDSTDYPDYAHGVCKKIIASPDPQVMGLLICGSGQGMAITANKYKEIRAALSWNENVAKLARQHNNANVLCLSSREVSEDLNYKILKTFLTTTFEGGRHLLRVQKINP